MRRKEKKQRSIKFYLCLLGSLISLYLIIVAVLAIRNPVSRDDVVIQNKPAQEIVQHPSEEEMITDETSNIEVLVPSTETPEKETVDISNYSRDGDRYTVMRGDDVIAKISVAVTNKEEVSKVVKTGYDSVRSYLNIFAGHESVAAENVTMLDYVYVGELGNRLEMYMQYDDPEETLVTVIFETATANHSSYVDVVPCQYTKKQILKRVWLK